jgi:hypothetical protein
VEKLISTYEKVMMGQLREGKVVQLTYEATLNIDVQISNSFAYVQKQNILKQRNSIKLLKYNYKKD